MRPLFVVLALGASSPALALSCVWGVYEAAVEDGATEVPTNPSILVNHTFDDPEAVEVELLDSTGAIVSIDLEIGHRYALVTPRAPLVSGTAYVLRTGDEGMIDVQFTTGSEPDLEAPEVPEILSTRRVRDQSEWGLTEQVEVELTPVDGAAWYEFELSEDEGFTEPLRYATPWPTVGLGNGLCLDTIDGYDHSVHYFVRARAVDLAGNTSEWTTPETPRGCSTVGGGAAPGGLALLALLAVGARRRRRE